MNANNKNKRKFTSKNGLKRILKNKLERTKKRKFTPKPKAIVSIKTINKDKTTAESNNNSKDSPTDDPEHLKKQKQTQPPETVILLDSDSEEEESPSESNTSDSESTLVEFEKVIVTQKDKASLDSQQAWLNDNLVDFYLALKRQYKPEKDKTYLFNSMFFMKLKSIQRSSNQDYYKETLSWFKNQEANKKPIWLIPICEGNHWYTIVVHHPISNKPSIFIFDSLVRSSKQHYNAVELIKTFLVMKYKQEKTGKFRRFKLTRVTVPQQDNCNDCGLHVLRIGTILFNLQEDYLKLAEGKGDHTLTMDDVIYKRHGIPSRFEIVDAINRLAEVTN